MKLTKRQRDEVATLLRCVAGYTGFFCSTHMGYTEDIYVAADRAACWVIDQYQEKGLPWNGQDGNPYLIEAALLVEEGELP